MTLIACSRSSNDLVLIADLLISGLEPAELPALPTMMNGIEHVFPKGSGFTPNGLGQKLFVVRPNVAVALAGRGLEMAAFLSAMRQQLSALPDSAEVRDLLATASEACESQLGGIVVHATTDAAATGAQFLVFEKSDEGRFHTTTCPVVACGSGRETYLKEQGGRCFEVGSRDGTLDEEQITPLLAQEIGIVGQLLAYELLDRSGSRLLEYWGTGYEIVSYQNFEFRKVRDIVYVFGNAKALADSTYETQPAVTMRYMYLPDETLGILCFDSKMSKAFGAIPVGTYPDSYSKRLVGSCPDLNAEIQCTVWVTKLGPFSMVTFGNDHPIKYYWESEQKLCTLILQSIGKAALPLLIKRHCARQNIKPGH
jgi:hypothetical protein